LKYLAVQVAFGTEKLIHELSQAFDPYRERLR
jgi:hypothetical protein